MLVCKARTWHYWFMLVHYLFLWQFYLYKGVFIYAVCTSPHFIPSLCFIPSPQFAVYVLYWPEKLCLRKKQIYYINTNEFVRGAFTKNPDIFFMHENISLSSHMKRLPLPWLHIKKWHLSQSAKWFGISLVFILIINRTLNGHFVTLIKTTKIEKWKNCTLNDWCRYYFQLVSTCATKQDKSLIFFYS